MPVEIFSGGTGSKLARATIIVAGVASLVATLISIVSIWLQTKNYRKPLLQRYVVRILLMVPIYGVSSWTSIVSLKASAFLTPIRDIYEAFTIYTFFQLLINFLGGERALIIMTHGRPPVEHAWPLNHALPKVDISDPYTFLAIKRGILQYAWLKPILALASIIMKATGTYQEGYLGLNSGYLWTGIIYNISVTISLYSLALFWVCMHEDLKPFRPVPKFLCVKLIIFASYWQGFFLSILQWLGALPSDIAGYTPDNLAAAIQDSLICFEMPIFALTHWYAFSWHDYADPSISAARMPVKYALRDAFGIRDLIEDTKETFRGENYQYRLFDSGDNVMAHEESHSRLARVMDGMRYERGGKAKYWIPRPGEVNSRTPLLNSPSSSRRGSQHLAPRGNRTDVSQSVGDVDELNLDEEDERWYVNARALEFGDWNYPVVTANNVSVDRRLPVQRPPVAPSYHNEQPEASHVRKAHKHRSRRIQGEDEQPRGSASRRSTGKSKRPRNDKQSDSPNTSGSSRRSQLVDLVDNVNAAKQQRSYPSEDHKTSPGPQDEARLVERPSGDENARNASHDQKPAEHATDSEDVEGGDESFLARDQGYGPFNEERDAWNSPGSPR
ncbi:hypothetical protein AJ80_04507 [Polytolypa hystricis UAMH7299]|uniref:DUF300 domain-containing protein n=1 Tax=Polytolypa hystricis (strain UAMH7299) TaxID=1447883 RepID=A0A2B7YB60_POLH7|nr:hypothetical protein AJ80_04507 [Polytolypa hystricis UAMH7299]